MATGKSKSYGGTAGELRVAAEAAARGYVPHIPAVDEGTDLWAVEHAHPKKGIRFQVKTASTVAKTYKDGSIGYRVTFSKSSPSPKGYYLVLHIVRDKSWCTLILKAEDFAKLHYGSKFSGHMPKSSTIIMTPSGNIRLSKFSTGPILDKHWNNWGCALKILPATSIYY